MRASRIRIGGFRIEGIPAILLGISGVILATGLAQSMAQIAPALPESIRETTAMLEAARHPKRETLPH